MFVSRLLRALIKRLFHLKDDFSSTDEIERYQLEKLKKKVKQARKTPYWNAIISKTCQEMNLSFSELLASIKSTRDFSRVIPSTDRVALDSHGMEMLMKPASKLIEAHTSGTSTNKPIKVYSSLLDVARLATCVVRNYEHMGIAQGDHLAIVIPHGSSLAQADGKIQMILPNAKFFYLDAIKNDEVTKILEADSMYSYANIPVQLFTRFQERVKDCKEKGCIKLRTIMGTGDFISEENARRLKELLGDHVHVYNPYNSIELLMSTYACDQGNIHVSSGYYYAEIAEENDELLMTPLSNESMHFFRYKSGDIVKRVECSCGNPDLAFKVIGRAYDGELHKNLRVDTIQNVIFSSEPFKAGKIEGESGIIKTYLTGDGRVIEVFVKTGDAFVPGEEDLIESQLHESITRSDEYAFKLLSTPEIKNWIVKFHLVDEFPSKVFSGKWKTQVA